MYNINIIYKFICIYILLLSDLGNTSVIIEEMLLIETIIPIYIYIYICM